MATARDQDAGRLSVERCIVDTALDTPSQGLARLPSVETLMSSAAVAPLVAQYGRTQTLAAVRRVLDAARQALRAPPAVGGAPAAAAPPLSRPLHAIFRRR